MRSKRLFLILALAALFVPAAAADVIVGQTSFSVSAQPALFFKAGARIVVSGKLKSSKVFCRSDRVVRLRSRTGRSARQVQKTFTDRKGNFRFVLRPNKHETVDVFYAGKVRSSYGQFRSCQPSRSKLITLTPRQA